MTNFTIDYISNQSSYVEDLKNYTTDDNNLDMVSYNLIPPLLCKIWYRDTYGDQWTGSKAIINDSSGTNIATITGPTVSTSKWASIDVSLINDLYSIVLTSGLWG